jgi:hypothetical protein
MVLLCSKVPLFRIHFSFYQQKATLESTTSGQLAHLDGLFRPEHLLFGYAF